MSEYRGVYWRCPVCRAEVVVSTECGGFGNLFKMMGMGDGPYEYPMSMLGHAEMEACEELVEAHEERHVFDEITAVLV